MISPQLPGVALAPGVHPIKYVAIDQDELSASCEFNITVNAYSHPRSRLVKHHHQGGQRINAGAVVQQSVPTSTLAKVPVRVQQSVKPKPQHHLHSELGPTEAYVMCPNRVAMKLDTTFPVSSFRVFYKNIYQAGEAQAHITPTTHRPRRIAEASDEASVLPSSLSGDRQPRHIIDIYHWVV